MGAVGGVGGGVVPGGGVLLRCRQARRQQTDQEYAQRLAELAGGRAIEAVVVDPSAASFLETLRRAGWNVRKADNEVLSGIRRTADA